MRKRIINILCAGKIFALIIVAYETLFLIMFSHLVDFETGIQFLRLFRYESFIPTGFGPFLAWLTPHVLIFIVVFGFFWWDWGEVPKYIAIGAVIVLSIMNSIWFASLLPFFMWIFLIYLLIRVPPIAFRKLFYFAIKRKNTPLRILTKQIPSWTQLLGIILILPLFIPSIPYITGSLEQPEPYIWNLEYHGGNFTERKLLAGNDSLTYAPSSPNTQFINVYLGNPVVESQILGGLYKIYGEDGGDFEMNKVLRLLYLNNVTDVLTNETRTLIEGALLYGKYWVDQQGVSNGLYWTENHQIGYHTAELLSGQMFRARTFNRTLMTGEEHIAHAEYMITKWIDWRARFGFSEYHSNVYYDIDFRALLNLVDFAENATIANKAAMLLDLMNFDFANNYFKDIYAIAHGRCYGESKVATVTGSFQNRDSIADAVWLWLGIGGYNGWGISTTEAFILTSTYQPSSILEKIAQDAKVFNEHKDRNGMNVDEGESYGIEYNEEDIMYWWGMTNYLGSEIIETTFDYVEKYDIDPALVFGPGVMNYTRFAANLRALSLSEFSLLMKEFTEGIAQEAANLYTYRTSYYQLSGLQDYQKGKNSVQEHIWQASLSNNAYIFTNAPGGLNWKGGPFMGGWMPRGVFHKNIGVIQYDHRHEIIGGKLLAQLADAGLNMFTGNRPKNHAYFPKWAFDQVVSKGRWTFGSKDGGYVALFSKNPTFWASDYELTALGEKNVWIVEMGSESEYASFADFIQQILSAQIDIKSARIGFTVSYDSPSQGLASVGWEGDFIVNGTVMDLEYERFENKYVSTAGFNSLETIIEFNGEKLTLNFANNTRLYEP
ncbi:MAG: hypothetical protein JW776_01290 [Candidatus Lokiarchaeota archaeon]|nr:hypothetical protein [Candidatus Lokiarchaeota archaeon]